MACFHDRCGERVTLLNENRTAVRDYSEFNHGLVISAEPLVNDVLFEVKIDQKMNSWSGSVEIGVTECDPTTLEFPACASKLQNGSWVMSGNSILMNGNSIVEFYGIDLEKLNEEDRVGVMRTSDGELVFFVNGEPQGVAARGLPSVLYAVIDLYGKCVKVTITHPVEREHNNDECLSCDSAEFDFECELFSNSLLDDFRNIRLQPRPNSNTGLPVPADELDTPIISNNSLPVMSRDRLRFHNRCGTLVKLTGNQRTAERRRPLDEFNNGVVMTHRSLRNDELFEIRLDRLVDKWSGSIEMGITTHNPTALEFPATMTNMRSGTIMMSGCGILTNGKGTRREYGEFNLDELREGDRVGMMRRSNGNLHYFINGLDQGVAASKVPEHVWGVIDLYGMTIKVTIVDRDEREEQNLITRRNTLLQDQHMVIGEQMLMDSDYCDRLMFHTNCGTHADVINNGRTAHRPNAADDFNNGVVLTSRPLKPGELFEVRLDKVVTKWAGSIEIGVTTHSPTELEFPFTMTNVRSGTWMMTGNGVMHNGTTILDQYGQNLDRLQVSDRVGVVRKENGTLHFYVNGNDQGPAASNVPERVFGVIDLYGQAAQVTIQDTSDCYSPDTVNSSLSNTTLYSNIDDELRNGYYSIIVTSSDLRFHHVHGKNARICNNGQSALRPHAFGEFNDAIVFSNRPLRDGELFEVTLDHMVDRWSGSIELGVTAVRPDDVDLPSTATDLDRDTWMLSGCSVMENGITIKNGYKCDLDVLTAGTRVGVMRNADKTLTFFLNGESQGIACEVPNNTVYAVVDLYGQCAQVSLTSCGSPSTAVPPAGARGGAQAGIVDSIGYPQSDTLSSLQVASVIQPPNHFTPDHIHRFSECHGKSIVLTEGNRVATRGRDLHQCLVFSAFSLGPGEIFEVSIVNMALQFAGSIKIGVTSFVPPELPSAIPYNIASIPTDCWYITGNEVRAKNKVLHHNFCPSLEWLRPGDRIGLKRTHDGGLRILVNSEEMGIAVHNLPEVVYAVIELFGTCTSVRVTSVRQVLQLSPTIASIRMQDSLEQVLEPLSHDDGKLENTDPEPECAVELETSVVNYEFHENHGRNIELSVDRKTAKRVASYNQGIVITSKPVTRGKIIEIKIGHLDNRWTSSLICGVVCCNPERLNYPVTALSFKRPCCILASDWISLNGTKTKSNVGQKLDMLTTGSKVSLLLTEQNQLQVSINGVPLESIPCELPSVPCYAVFDLYGQCQQITLLNARTENNEVVPIEQIPSTSVDQCDSQQCEKADLESREKESSLCSNSDTNLTLDLNRNTDTDSNHLLENQPTNQTVVVTILNTPSTVESNKKCEYMKNCMKFMKSLILPDAFFLSDEAICFCNICYQLNSQDEDIYKGVSPEYNPPKGWVKFYLKNFSNTQTDKWHVAFYGTKLCVIRAILDRGQPLTTEQLQSCNLSTQPCEKEESQSTQIVFYPSIEYATADSSLNYVTSKNKQKLDVRTAFQLLVRPGSYSTQGQGDGFEWSTKETGAIVLHALLLRLQECC